MPAVPRGDGGVAAGGPAGSAGGLDFLQQGWLIVLQLNDQASLCLCGSLEDGVDGPNGISVPECGS